MKSSAILKNSDMFLLLYDNIFSTNAILQAKYSHTLTIL